MIALTAIKKLMIPFRALCAAVGPSPGFLPLLLVTLVYISLGTGFGMGLGVSAAQASDIRDVRVYRSDEYTRVVFDVDARVAYSVFVLSDPHRVVIDVSNSSMLSSLSGLSLGGTPIQGVRSAPRDGGDTRVVLDVSRAVNPTSFLLEPNEQLGYRLVVDLYDVNRDVPVREPTPPPQVVSSPRRDIVVAIDAGHGGDDPGAIGFDGRIREKDVALGVARALYERLNQVPGYHPVMVRSGDYFVQLQRRPQIARQNRADIFLSIHADSFRSASAEGVTIYALSQSTAQAENNRRVADRENHSDLLGGMGGDTSLVHFEDDLALTLLDLSMSWSIEQSLSAGQHVLDSMGRVARLRRDTPQRANLWVLRSPDIPSLLIETGYLSNPNEARRLTTAAYQQQLGDAIARGVMNYFHDQPPEGTMIAWNKENGELPRLPPLTSGGGRHVVVRGDSLSTIAQRHGVRTADLRSANNLRGDVIHVGQELVIPGAGMAASNSVSEHTIARGETLSGIAQRYRVSLSRLREVNNIRGDTIHVGQVLIIPSS